MLTGCLPLRRTALFLAKALGNFIFVSVLEALMAPLFMIFYNLRVAGSGVAVDSGGDSGNVGAGGERNVFCGDVVAHAQPRDYVAAAVVPHLDSSRAWRWWRHDIILTGDGSARFWIVLLLTYDVVFTTACLALFETILQAE